MKTPLTAEEARALCAKLGYASTEPPLTKWKIQNIGSHKPDGIQSGHQRVFRKMRRRKVFTAPDGGSKV